MFCANFHRGKLFTSFAVTSKYKEGTKSFFNFVHWGAHVWGGKQAKRESF